MSIGAAIYSYRTNFNCKKSPAKKGKSTKIKLFNLIIDRYQMVSNFDDDYFICIAQYLLKKGYPLNFSVNNSTENLDKFFMDSLFSINPFHYENLIRNHNGFDIFEWRKQFDLFGETQIKGLNFYRKRSAMPLKNFSTLSDIYKIIYTNHGKYNEENNKLKFSFNECHLDAIWILSKYCVVSKDRFYYIINYGCQEDASSSWEITIESEENENYVDFCLRIYNNYDEIISGNKDVLISDHPDDEKNFYLSGHFKLRNTINTTIEK